MKTLIISLVLLCSVLAFLFFNAIFLNNFFEEIYLFLDDLPSELSEIEGMSETEREKTHESLIRMREKWEKFLPYLYFTKGHDECHKLTGVFLPAVSDFESEEFAEFISKIVSAKEALQHMVFTEKLSFGNIL